MTATIWTPGVQTSPSLPAVSPVQFIAGTAAAPSITLVGDTNTGIWSAGDGVLGISSNGVNQFTVKGSEVAVEAGALKLAPELTIASAATCDIGSIASNSIAVTGNASIGSFGSNYSGPKFLRFTGTATLNNSVNLILVGGVNITATPGDCAIVVPKATAGVPDGWAVVSYQGATQAAARNLYDVYGRSETYTSTQIDTLVTANLAPLGGFRNRVMNGDFSVDQENVGASQTITAGAALKYVLDGWYAYCTGANLTFQQVTVNNKKRARFTGLAGNTGLGFGHRIESANSSDMANLKATLSMLLSSTSITSATWTLYYANTVNTFGTLAAPTRTTIQSGTFTITSTETLYSAITSAVLASGATTGLELVITTGALLATQTLTIGDVQVEKGYVTAPVFEAVDASTQFNRCTRRLKFVSSIYMACTATTGTQAGIEHPNMFSAPSIIVNTPITIVQPGIVVSTQSAANGSVSSNTKDGGEYLFGNFSGLTTGVTCITRVSGGRIGFRAEIA